MSSNLQTIKTTGVLAEA